MRKRLEIFESALVGLWLIYGMVFWVIELDRLHLLPFWFYTYGWNSDPDMARLVMIHGI